VCFRPPLTIIYVLQDRVILLPGIVIAGPPGAGKSTVVRGLIEALRNVSKSGSRSSPNRTAELSESNHKLQKLYPLVVDDLALIFGSLNQNHDWVDGIFTSAWRKASRVGICMS